MRGPMSGGRRTQRFEVELPGPWPACPHCGASTRVAVASARGEPIGFACGGPEMHRLRWDGEPALPRTLFLAGGEFAGLVPLRYLPPAGAAARNAAFETGERRREWIHAEQPACAACGVPPMRDWDDGGALIDWLRAYDPDLYADVAAVVAARRPRPARTTWYASLLDAQTDLIARINFRVADSYLQAQRCIPSRVLARHWQSWPRAVRRVATDTLAFGMCVPCGRLEHDRLPARDELLRRHVALNYAGSIAAAQADGPTWSALQRLLASLAASDGDLSALDAAR